MYAIVDIAGKQFKVSKDDTIFVPKIDGEAGKTVEFKNVLLISDKDKVSVGKPQVSGASVKGKILGFGRDKKVIVFKKKRRKGFQVKRGHRQPYTNILVQNITVDKKITANETTVEQ